MIDMKQPVHRRGFLTSVTAGATALGLASLAAQFKMSAETTSLFSGSDLSQFDSWLGKIKGKHKQVFDAPSANSGFPLAWSRIFLMTNKQVGVMDDDMTAVLILRHDAIPVGMEHSLWPKYKFGENFKITDGATKAPAVRNPFYQPKEGELPLPGMAMEDLLKSGVLVGICDMALTFYSKHMAESFKMEADAIKKDWVDGILPGIQIVPSGVLAINRAQEHGCTYCYAGEG